MEIEVVHMVCTLRIDNELWQGEGFWPCPSTGRAWKDLADDVCRCLIATIPTLGLAHRVTRFRCEGERYIVHGRLASAMLCKINGPSTDPLDAMIWSPVIETRYTLGEHENGTRN